MSVGGTTSYDGATGLPNEVLDAVGLARSPGFENSCRLEQGRLLRVLAAGRDGGIIGETGTGCGVGLSWMVGATSEATRFVSVEIDEVRALACQRLFAHHANVRIDIGNWVQLLDHGPFDLLVLDGGGAGKTDEPVDVHVALKIGGMLVVDDFTPFTVWPPTHDGDRDQARLHWLDHPCLIATEIRLAPDLSTVVAVRVV